MVYIGKTMLPIENFLETYTHIVLHDMLLLFAMNTAQKSTTIAKTFENGIIRYYFSVYGKQMK